MMTNLESIANHLERSLLDVYPEAEVVKDSGKLNLVHILSSTNSFCEPIILFMERKSGLSEKKNLILVVTGKN